MDAPDAGTARDAWTEVYTRCMDGEFFRGVNCPRDGYSSEISERVSTAVRLIRETGTRLTLAELARNGLSEEDLRDVMIAEFASRSDAPDWLRPDG